MLDGLEKIIVLLNGNGNGKEYSPIKLFWFLIKKTLYGTISLRAIMVLPCT
jgi:hypothetical protein